MCSAIIGTGAHKLKDNMPIIDVIEQILGFICARPVSPINLSFDTVHAVRKKKTVIQKILIVNNLIFFKIICKFIGGCTEEKQGAREK